MRALEFSFLVGSASGWVTISQARFGAQIDGIVQQMRGLTTDMEPNIQQKLGYLWTFPEDSDDTTGLGGGITWQWDPRLCDSILDQFSEDFFFVAFITSRRRASTEPPPRRRRTAARGPSLMPELCEVGRVCGYFFQILYTSTRVHTVRQSFAF